MISRLTRTALLATGIFSAASASAQTNFATLTTDGCWTWFNDPRAIFHNGVLYFGYVQAAGGGKSALSVFNLQSGKTTNLWTSVLTENDDHDNPGLLVRPDGTIFANYARHGGDQFFSYRISSSTNPVSPGDWSSEQRLAASGAGLTYANPYQLSGESGKCYEFSRDLNYNPTVFTSADNGATWSGPTLMIQTGTGGTRPYVKYCSDYSSRIDFIYTDAHPDNYTTSLYHLYYQSNNFYMSDGTLLKSFANLPILHDSGERGTVIYQYNSAATVDPNQWIATARAWTWEIAYQTNAAPVCVFQTKVDAVTGSTWADARIYYYYARWTGTNWQKRFIAQAGRPLYNGQPDYGGGMALDPQDVNTIYISSDAANPFDLSTTTSIPLGAHYEIYKGVTTNGGLTFTWSAMTTNSAVDNCRPYVPRRFGGEPCVIWWRGNYTSYTSFNTSVVGLFTTAVPVQSNAVVTLPPAIAPVQIRKTNNTVNASLGTSWVGGNSPNAGNVTVWDNTVTVANSIALGANTSWSGILVTNPGGAVNLTAGNTLTLGASGIDMSGATANLTISSSLTLGTGDQIWSVTNGRTLALNTGTFSRSSNATLNVQGSVTSSMASLTNDASVNGGILGPWATTGKGAATAYATLVGGSITNYTGAAVVAYNTIPNPSSAATNYTINVAGSVAYGAATRTVNTLALTAGATTLTWGNSASQINLIANGILNSGSGLFALAQGGSSSLSGVMVGANNGRELVINAANAPVTVSARIIDNTGGASSVVVTGTTNNPVTLSGASTFSRGMTLNAGSLILGNAAGLGGTSGPLAVNGGTLDLGNFSPTVGTATISGGVIQNGTLTATSFTANNPNSAAVGAVLAGASAPLVKNNFGTLVLAAQNTYGGATMVNAGNLNLLGSIAGSATVNGGTLSGNGTIGGAVTNQSGTLAPGADASTIGTLTVNNSLTLLPGSTTFIKVTKNGDGVVNDALTGITSLTCGGAIVVTNIGVTALAAGDTFQFFSAASFSGNFSATNFPSLGPNLFWTNRLAVDGTLAVLSSVVNYPTNISVSLSGTSLFVAWPATHLGWILQVQTNGLGTNWIDLPASAALTATNLPMNPTVPSAFYRLRHP